MNKKPLILPIKRVWFDKIVSGEKKEEYRDVKPYYTARFLNATGLAVYASSTLDGESFDFMQQIRKTPSSLTVRLRAGYSASCPTCLVRGRLAIGGGKPEWGAEPGVEYYVIKVDDVVLETE